MTKKLFTLIHGKELRVAPGKKVIPAESVGTLLDVNEVMTQIKQDAEKFKAEIVAECEKERKQARSEGFREGMEQWATQVDSLEKRMRELQKEYRRLILPVAMKAARKIVGREIELSEDTLADIITQTLRSVSQHQRITIYVDQASLELMERNRPKLKSVFERLETLTIEARDDMKPGGCVIETEAGIINAEIENQWEQLQTAMEEVMTDRETGGQVEAS